MVILYTIQDNYYVDIKNIDKNADGSFTKSIYVNITNRCPCACSFCIRHTKELLQNNSLWLPIEPTAREIIEEFENTNISKCKEIVFCGFGEPLERVETVAEVAEYLKGRKPDVKIRVNTNGLENLAHGKDITVKLKGLVDTISISLNASDKEKYLEITNSKFGIESFDAMLAFAKQSKENIVNVVLSVVDVIGEDEINKCKEVCKMLNIKLRVREFE